MELKIILRTASRRPVVTGGARYIAPVVANVRKIT